MKAGNALIHDLWRAHLGSVNPALLEALLQADETGDFGRVQEILDSARLRDPLFRGEDDSKYRKMLAYAAFDKIIPAFKKAMALGKLPEIEISKDDGEAAARHIGVSIPKSPQDFLYTFISERAPAWVSTLNSAGFVSATMSGNQQMTLMISPRLLDLPNMAPDREVLEPSSALSDEFRDTMAILSEQPNVNVLKQALGPEKWAELDFESHPDSGRVPELIDQLMALMNERGQREVFQLRLAIQEIKETVLSQGSFAARNRALRKFVNEVADEAPRQEQLALKFLDDGRYLQRLLGGINVEEISSNLKMQPNRLRGNKVEVDRLYKVGGQERILLVETKGGNRISRGQLYQLYETFALRLPANWDVDVIAVLLYREQKLNVDSGEVEQMNVLDVAVIDFDDNLFGDPSMATIDMNVRKHFRWLIPDVSRPA